MDARQYVGIALGDTDLSAVLLRTSGRRLEVAASASQPLAPQGVQEPRVSQATLADMLVRLCEELPWQRLDPCVLGLPLSLLSVRNLRLPFREARQQAQAFPFEMEEGLLVPAEQVKSVFHTTGTDAAGADLLAFAVERQLLAKLLAGQGENACEPDIICPAVHALALQATTSGLDDLGNLEEKAFLLLYADLSSVSVSLVQAGTPVMHRCLPWPMALEALEALDNREAMDKGKGALKQTVWQEAGEGLARSIRQTLVLFRQRNRAGAVCLMAPEAVLLCGPLAHSEALDTSLAQCLHLPVQRLRLAPDVLHAHSLSPAFDAALACALHAVPHSKVGAHRPDLNFRSGTFARDRGPLWRRKEVMWAAAMVLLLCFGVLAFLGKEVRSLKLRSAQLRQEMSLIYRGAFPQVQVVHDPYLEMQAALRGGASQGVPLLFAPARESVLSLLADISTRIPAQMDMQFNRLSLDESTLSLRGKTSTFKDVDRIRALLAASPLFSEVNILSSTAEQNGAETFVRFELRLQRTVTWSNP